MEERVCLDSRRHGIVLAKPFSQAFAVAGAGGVLVALPFPLPVFGAAVMAAAAVIALRAAWRWERTHVVVTTEKLFVVNGTLRRRAAAVRLDRVGAVEVEQGIAGRVLGYGTLIAGPLEVDYVPAPRRVHQLVEQLSA